MTENKAFKAAIRERMAETGEPYSVARRAVESGQRSRTRPARAWDEQPGDRRAWDEKPSRRSAWDERNWEIGRAAWRERV